MRDGRAGYMTRNWCVFKYDTDELWPVVPAENWRANSLPVAPAYWLAVKIETQEKFIHRTFNGLTEALGLPRMDQSFYKKYRDGEAPYRGYLFQRKETREDLVDSINH